LGPWQRSRAVDLYWIASRLDPAFLTLAQTLDVHPMVQALFA
jgi:hypothetical protein